MRATRLEAEEAAAKYARTHPHRNCFLLSNDSDALVLAWQTGGVIPIRDMNLAEQKAVLFTEKDVCKSLDLPIEYLPSFAALAQWENAADVRNRGMLWDAFKAWEHTLPAQEGVAKKTDFKSNESVMHVMADILKAFGSLDAVLKFLVDKCQLEKAAKEEIQQLAARLASLDAAMSTPVKDLKSVEQGAACEGK